MTLLKCSNFGNILDNEKATNVVFKLTVAFFSGHPVCIAANKGNPDTFLRFKLFAK